MCPLSLLRLQSAAISITNLEIVRTSFSSKEQPMEALTPVWMSSHQWQTSFSSHHLLNLLLFFKREKKKTLVLLEWPVCQLWGCYWLCTHHIMDSEPSPAEPYWYAYSEPLRRMIHHPTTQPTLRSSIRTAQIEPFLRYDNFLQQNQSRWLWLC